MATDYKQIPIRLTPEQHRTLKDMAQANERAGNKEASSISQIVRQAVAEYLKNK